jgi:hypothetical protein
MFVYFYGVGKGFKLLLVPHSPQMFFMPAFITLSIAATRMYRSLADFHWSTDVYVISFKLLTVLTLCGHSHRSVDSVSPPKIPGSAIPNSQSTFTVPAPPRRVEVAVHTAHEKYCHPLTNEKVVLTPLRRQVSSQTAALRQLKTSGPEL